MEGPRCVNKGIHPAAAVKDFNLWSDLGEDGIQNVSGTSELASLTQSKGGQPVSIAGCPVQTASMVEGGLDVMLYVTLTTPGTSEVIRFASLSSLG